MPEIRGIDPIRNVALCDVPEWDGILSSKLKLTAKDDGIDRQSPCLTIDADGRESLDIEKFERRRARHRAEKKARPGLVFSGILANEVLFMEFFERDIYTGGAVRAFYCQVPMILDRYAIIYSGRETGKSWTFKGNSLHRATNFPGSSLLIGSHDKDHVEPRMEEIWKICDNHPFFSRMIPKRNTGGRNKKGPSYRQDFTNRFTLHGVYPGEDGANFEKFHVDGWLGDECIARGTLVTMADGTRRPIEELVETRSTDRVLTYNPTTGQIEPKRITGWYKNPRRSRSIITIGDLRMTEDHPVYVRGRGYIRADRLGKSDILLEIHHDVIRRDYAAYGTRALPVDRVTTGRRVGHAAGQGLSECSDAVSTRCGAVTISSVEVRDARALVRNGNHRPGHERMGWPYLPFRDSVPSRIYRPLSSDLPGSEWSWEEETDHSRVSGHDRRRGAGGVVHGRRQLSGPLRVPLDVCILTRGHRSRDRVSSGLRHCVSASGEQEGRYDLVWPKRDRIADDSDRSSSAPMSRLQGRDHETRLRDQCLSSLRGNLRQDPIAEGLLRPTRVRTGTIVHVGQEETSLPPAGSQAQDASTLRLDVRKVRCHDTDQPQTHRADSAAAVQSVSRDPAQSDDLWVYCLDVEDNHNFFAGGLLVHNCQELSTTHMEKWQPTQNDFQPIRGSICKFFGVNSNGRTDIPFYQMSFHEPQFKGHVYVIPSWNNPREYSIKKHDGYLTRYGGSVEATRFKQMIRGKTGDRAEGVMNPRHYANCCEVRERLSLALELPRNLPYQKRRFDAQYMESRDYRFPAILPQAPVLPEYDDMRIGMDFGFGGGATAFFICARIRGIWHLTALYELLRIPEPRQAEFAHYLLNREGQALYPQTSYMGIDVTGNRNIYAFLTDKNDVRFNNPVNDYFNRLVPINFERPIVVDKVLEAPPASVRSKKTKLPDGSTAWDIFEDSLVFSTGLITKRMGESGYSWPAEDDVLRTEYLGMTQQGRKFFGYRGQDHVIAAHRCFELTIHEKDTLTAVESQLLSQVYFHEAPSAGIGFSCRFSTAMPSW